MATKIEWQASDHAAQKVLADLMKESGLSYRAMESRANAGISFVRFRDIAFGRRAPVRLTEFLAICEVCHADPVATLQRIIDEARRIQAQEAEAAAAREPEPVDPVAATLAKVQRGDYDVVALRSSHKYDGDGDEAA